MNDLATENLSVAALLSVPSEINWIESSKAGRWEIVYPDFSEFSDFSLDDYENITGQKCKNDLAVYRLVEKYFYENTDQLEPMYNYWYPLPCLSESPEVAQAILVKNSNVCTIVNLDNEPVLALAGCGMDFSWSICKAYILLGYLPPFHFCDLPEMAGYSDDIIRDACIESCEAVKGRAISQMQSLKEL